MDPPKTSQPPLKDHASSSQPANVEGLIALQADHHDGLKQILKNFKKDSSTRKTKSYCQVRLDKVEMLHKEFFDVHKRLICSSLSRDSSYFKDATSSKFEELYFDLRASLLEALEEQQPQKSHDPPPNPHTGHTQTSSLELPKLPLPSFTGKYTDWPAFHDAYIRLIHNNTSLSAIHKFHFLKKALPDDKDIDVQQMELTEINYPTAWELIVKRYNNPRLLFMHHMNKLFSIPALTKERADGIKSLLNAAKVCINEFQRLQIPISDCDHWIAYYVSIQLPKETHQAWEHHLGSNTDIPTFSAIESFLNDRLITINVIENRQLHIDMASSSRHNTSAHLQEKRGNWKANHSVNKSFHVTAQPKKAASCYLCGDAHVLRHCSTFLAKDCFERKAIVDRAKLCLNCLSNSHACSHCPSNKNCLQCGQRHHTLLHFPTSAPQAEGASVAQSQLNHAAQPFRRDSAFNSNSPQTTTVSKAAHSTFVAATTTEKTTRQVLLATAMVTLVNDVTGQTGVVRALIDNGSEATLISEHAAQTVGLARTRASAEISGVNGTSTKRCNFTVSFSIRSCINPAFNTEVDVAYVLNVLTNSLPSEKFVPQNWPHIQGLQLADPSFFQSRRIDLLIGADMMARIMLPETRIGRFDEPIAQHTQLGWILTGNAMPAFNRSKNIRCHHSTLQLESLVQKFYEHEQIPADRALSQEENWCENHFQQTHLRQSNGKYLVRLPLKHLFDHTQTLGKSKQIALNRFHYLERKLQRDEELCKRYRDCIQEYFTLNQITPATTTERDHCVHTTANIPTVTSCVLPHHAVLKEESLTTKLRVVFDASCKTTNGRSLNDVLCTGPALQNDLSAVILNWRKHKYAFTADIQKMYRCIDMQPEDSQYQRILWRNDEGEIKDFCLTTVTFGTASAPYTAIRVLHQIAEDEKQSYPLAGDVLKYEVYVDDVLSGSDSIGNAAAIRKQVTAALRSAGMNLRKWSSNSVDLLDGIPQEHMSSTNCLNFNSTETVKTLGMCWQPNQDIFIFKLNFEIDFSATKRAMLSTIARLFDPQGLIAPIIVTAKILLKSVWMCKIQRTDQESTALDWDEQLPEDINHQWQNFVSTLSTLHCIKIPRWLQYEPTHIKSLQLHAFCDGSLSAYAANVYLRVECSDNRIYTTLLIAKSRVTPIKPLTIPRIELSGAVLATELATWTKKFFVAKNLDLPIFYWTDATIVLYWIFGDLNRWQTWVSNRVSKILQASSPHQWNHVDTLQNPADCATRGLTPTVLSTFTLWWTGPAWLKQADVNWPKFDHSIHDVQEEIAEVKRKQLQVNFSIAENSVIFRYSSLHKTIRVCAYIFRFAHNSRTQAGTRQTGPLSVAELIESVNKIVKLVQYEAFSKEIICVREKSSLPSNSKLTSLAPFLDEQGVLRLRGRIQRAMLPYDQRHPIILPSSHHFTSLVINSSHLTTLHGGPQLTISHIRQKFWIVNARRVVKQQLRKCVNCFRNKPTVASQLMGDLPFHRVNPPQRPFLATGIDYTGAIELKSSRYRGNTTYKGYIAVFICLATKAVHLEAVTGMSSEAFLLALQRFIGRRGLCKDIFSDCGTNFIGADKVLQASQRKLVEDIKQDIVPRIASHGIQWHFNPPHSPNFGGLWEANVKAVKYHLKRVLSGIRLTFEVLSTLLVRIESCLNSRPLCPLTSDPDDLMVLTPGHFLIGSPLLSPPVVSEASNISLSQQFLQTQRMLQHFWQRWKSDWLAQLQTRPKWCQQRPNLQLNDLVIVKDERLPPNEWTMARVTELHPGPDNLVRVVTVRTQNGTYKRSISKLCPLPIPTYTHN